MSRWSAAILYLLCGIISMIYSIIVNILTGIFDLLKDILWALIEPVLLGIEPRVDRLYIRYKVKMEIIRMRRPFYHK